MARCGPTATDEKTRAQATAAGAIGHLTKPGDGGSLVECFQAA
jgi:hypothetical protein